MPSEPNARSDRLAEKPISYRSAWQEAAALGVDMNLLEDSLRLSPWQRLLENDSALALVRMLERAKVRDDGSAD